MIRIIIAAVAVLAFLTVPLYFLRLHSAVPAATTTPQASVSAFTYANASENNIYVTAPKPGGNVTDTIIVTGYARGPWFFEAVFPVEVKNKDGIVIGTAQGKAKGDWMTTSFVPFMAEVDLKTPYNGPAVVVLKKDNPSGDSARDASVSFPITIE